MHPMVELARALSDRANEGIQPEEVIESFESMTVDQLDEFVKNGGEGSFIGQLALSQQNEWEEKTAMAVKMGMEMAKESVSKEFVAKAAKSTLGKLSPRESLSRATKFRNSMQRISDKNANTPVTKENLELFNRQMQRELKRDDAVIAVNRADIERGLPGKSKTSAGVMGNLWSAGKAFMGTGAGKALGGAVGRGAGIGALAGGGLGAARGLIKNPGFDPATGQQRSRLGAAAKGAIGGAALGAAGGAAVGGVSHAAGKGMLGQTAQQAHGWAGQQIGAAKNWAGNQVNKIAPRVPTQMELPLKAKAASVDFSRLSSDFIQRTR